MDIHEHFDLRPCNSFHVAARSRYLIDIDTAGQLPAALEFAGSRQLPLLVMGQGSNMLLRSDFPGLVLRFTATGTEILAEDAEYVRLRVQAGANWHEFVLDCLQQGWYGLENLSLIPGTVGAAPVQNIGAYGVELASFVEEVQACELATGSFRVFSAEECRFSYRDSVFKTALRERYLITAVTFRLLKQARLNLTYPALQQALQVRGISRPTPLEVSNTVSEIRRSKLPDPDVIGNAGSFFRNPLVSEKQFSKLQAQYPDIVAWPAAGKRKLAAAWLIEKAGWKGFREGDAGVHAEHALVLVNHGAASGEDICRLACRIQNSVATRFGVRLEPEVRIIPAADAAD